MVNIVRWPYDFQSLAAKGGESKTKRLATERGHNEAFADLVLNVVVMSLWSSLLSECDHFGWRCDKKFEIGIGMCSSRIRLCV